VKAGILRSIRGVHGGVVFARKPEEVTLLEVLEACEGLLTASYCQDSGQTSQFCSFHAAMKDLHEVVSSTLSKWTIQDLLKNPARCPEEGPSDCRMYFADCYELTSIAESV
jgi:Rrf2 family protein